MKPSKAKKTNSTLRGILICMILLMMVISGGIASIHAYFTDADSLSNNFTVGNNVITITDQSVVKVTNDNTDRAIPCYIRVFAAKEDGSALPSVNTTYWEKPDGDDYYYYKDPVAPGGTTAQLFNQAVTGTSDSNKLIVYAESIQAEGFSSAQEAFKS